MAQALHCDYTGCERLGDWITSRTDNGDTFAWCQEHYVLLCRSVVAQADQDELEAPAQPELDLGAVPELGPDDDEDDDEDAIHRLERLGVSRAAAEAVIAAEQALAEQPPAEPQVIEGYAPPDGSGEGAWSEDVPQEPAPADDAAGSPQDAPGAPQAPEVVKPPTRVVRRGTSPSRRAHEARKRAKGGATAQQSGGTNGDTPQEDHDSSQEAQPGEGEAGAETVSATPGGGG